jgi:hypothetical protein
MSLGEEGNQAVPPLKLASSNMSPLCRNLVSLCALLLVVLPASQLMALVIAFTPGSIVVQRTGGDTNFGGSPTAPTTSATAVFLDEFLPNGTRVNTIALPTIVNGNNLRLTDVGFEIVDIASGGHLTRTTDGRYLVIPGYDAALGTANVNLTSPITVNRVIGRIGYNFGSSPTDALTTSTGFSNSQPANTFRSVASDNGNRFWAGVAGSSTFPGIFHVSPHSNVTGGSGSAPAATAVLPTASVRVNRIFTNTLFFSAALPSTGFGVFMVDFAGILPTSGSFYTNLTGTATSGTGVPSPYGFALFDINAQDYNQTGLDRLYIADDRSLANGGGLQRWDFNGSTWVLTYTLTNGLNDAGNANSIGGLRGLTSRLDGNGNPEFFVTTKGIATGRTMATP